MKTRSSALGKFSRNRHYACHFSRQATLIVILFQAFRQATFSPDNGCSFDIQDLNGPTELQTRGMERRSGDLARQPISDLCCNKDDSNFPTISMNTWSRNWRWEQNGNHCRFNEKKLFFISCLEILLTCALNLGFSEQMRKILLSLVLPHRWPK